MFEKWKRKLGKKDSATKIFITLKANTYDSTESSLDEYYKNTAKLAEEFLKTGQTGQVEKLIFLMDCVRKEKEVLKHGISKYIFRDDIEEFLDRRDVKAANIKLIELSDYPRKIPKDIREKIEKTKDIFDVMYVLFTDYTSTVTKNYQKEKKIIAKDKDPILFGTFQEIETANDGMSSFNRIRSRKLNDKFYVIGDWVDEYCDLTLDKFVAMTREDIVKDIGEVKTVEELKNELKNIKDKNKMRGNLFNR